MGDWTKDHFLGDFLITDLNGGVFDDRKEDGFEDCSDLCLVAAADDDTLVSYLSGEMYANTNVAASKPSSKKKSAEVPSLNHTSQLKQTQIISDHLESSHACSQQLAKPVTVDLENDSLEDCVITSYDLSSDDGSDSTAMNGTEDMRKSDRWARNTDPARQLTVVMEQSVKSTWGKCNTKNAIAARQRRLKYKQHQASLEESVKKLSEENELLKKQDSEKTHQVEQLQKEITYLKHVIANKSILSSLLKNMGTVNGLKLAYSQPPTGAEPDQNRDNRKACTVPHGKRKHPDRLLEVDENSSLQVSSSPKRLHTHPAEPVTAAPGQSQNGCPPLQDLFNNSGTMVGSVACHTLTDKQHAVVEFHGEASSKEMTGVGRDDPANLTVGDLDGSSTVGTGGICLHVLGDSVSIELCATCNHNAVKYRTILPDLDPNDD